MKLQFIKPSIELAPYISKLWLFENEGSLAMHGTLIAPNARPKIIIPYINSLTTTDNGRTSVCKEGSVYFIGIRDVPVTLGTPPGSSGSIGIELTTSGAYKFLSVPMHELTNNLFTVTELFGKQGRELLSQLNNEPDPLRKTDIIQAFLKACLLRMNRVNSIVDYSIDIVLSHSGLVDIKDLEKKTGYTKRYLDMLFKQHLGISPKTYSTIIRFQNFYKNWQGNLPSSSSSLNAALDVYYDQSHFIKEFKRYTGLTPGQYSKTRNDFGKNF